MPRHTQLPEGGLLRTSPPTQNIAVRCSPDQQQQELDRPRDLRASLAQFSLTMFSSPPPPVSHHQHQQHEIQDDEDDGVRIVGGDDFSHQQQPPRHASSSEDEDAVVLLDENEPSVDQHQQHPSFQVPTLPQGHIVVVRVLSTWGSERCVGLSGIEFFDELGEQIQIPCGNILEVHQGTSSSSSSSSSSQQQSNGSTMMSTAAKNFFPVSNIVREPFDSTDECSMWLQVLDSSNHQHQHHHHRVLASFAVILPAPASSSPSGKKQQQRLSAMRVWNYNGGGRSHVERGARHVEVFLDEQMIFRGEVRPASGDQRNEDGVETVLFSDNVGALTKIAEQAELRSRRWNGNSNSNKHHGRDGNAASQRKPVAISARPANGAQQQQNDLRRSFCVAQSQSLTHAVGQQQQQQVPVASAACVTVRDCLQLVIASAWDDETLVGLSALQFLDDSGAVIEKFDGGSNNNQRVTVECSEGWAAIEQAKKRAQQQQKTTTAQADGDDIDSYFIPELVDNDPNTRWVHQIQEQYPVVLTIRFPSSSSSSPPQQKVSAVRIANFAGADHGRLPTSMGVKHLRMLADGIEIIDGKNSSTADEEEASSLQWLVARKAPAGSHRLTQLLFQTWTAAALSSGGDLTGGFSTSGSSSNNTLLLSASVTTAARVAIQRANYASAGVKAWPEWCRPGSSGSSSSNNAAAAALVDTDVPYLPCAYTFSLSFRLLREDEDEERQQEPASISISNILLLNEDGSPLEQDFVCWEPERAGKSREGPFLIQQQQQCTQEEEDDEEEESADSVIHVAFDTMRCMSLLAFEVTPAAVARKQQFEVTVMANDVPIYGTVVSCSPRRGATTRHVVPFCPDERIFGRFKEDMVAMSKC